MLSRIPIIAIIGPTGAGKTQLSIKLAKAVHGEVISVDSIQLYRDAPIMSGAVTVEEMDGINHHFVGCLEAFEEPTDFISSAVQCIRWIHQSGHIPILCGGSISLTEPLLFHPFIAQQDLLVISLNCHLETLGTLIDSRISQMVQDGLREEVRHLNSLQDAYEDIGSATINRGAWKAIGYPELRLSCSVTDLEKSHDMFHRGIQVMKKNTREYAKLQLQQLWGTILPALFQQQRTCYVFNVESRHSFQHDVEIPATEKCKRWLSLRQCATSRSRADSAIGPRALTSMV